MGLLWQPPKHDLRGKKWEDMNGEERTQVATEAADAYWDTLNEEQQKNLWTSVANDLYFEQELEDPETGEMVRNKHLQNHSTCHGISTILHMGSS